jgi:predicted flap endonuclease-1-like 5' DNA nuclease
MWTNDTTPDAFVANPFGTVNSVVELPAPAAKKITKKVVAKKAPAKKIATKSSTDDLTKIEGIGPKVTSLLSDAGIITFSDLGATKVGVLRSILAEAGNQFNVHNPSTWAKQAKLATKGNWDKLKKLQDELNGGV